MNRQHILSILQRHGVNLGRCLVQQQCELRPLDALDILNIPINGFR